MTEGAELSDLDRLLRERLEQRGWRITRESQRGLDTDLDVEIAGALARVRLRHACVGSVVLPNLALAPAFVRIDIGAPDGQVDAWAIKLAPMATEDGPRIGYQTVAGGDWTWASAAVGMDVPATADLWRPALDQLLDKIELLRPERPTDSKRHALRSWTERVEEGSRLGLVGFISAVVLVCALFSGALALIWIVDADGRRDAPTALAISLGFALVVALTHVARRLVRSLQARRASPPDQLLPILHKLRTAGCFTGIEVTSEQWGDLPVVTKGAAGPEPGCIEVRKHALRARAPTRGAVLTLTLWICSAPAAALAECRLLPARTALLRVEGADALLALLPHGSHRDRLERAAVFRLHDHDLDGATLGALVDRVVSTVSEPRPAYR